MTFDPSSYKAAQRVFRTRLIKWWQTNRRDFQWRQTSDPYEILVAEILLRRTNAKAAQKIYVEFLNKFPTSQALANADASVIESVAKKLGLFWRAKNLSALSLFFKEGGGQSCDVANCLAKIGELFGTEIEFEVSKNLPNGVRLKPAIYRAQAADLDPVLKL